MFAEIASLELSEAQFQKISQTVYQLSGIHLTQGKEGLIKTRLTKRLRALGLASFSQYLRYVEEDKSGQELALMIEALTTNKTSFFREPQHFDFLRKEVIPELRGAGPRIRLWSAGCSSGEEPFSIAIVLREDIPDIDRRDVRILATDISAKMLAAARQALYSEQALTDVPPRLLQKYFLCVQTMPTRTYRASDDIRAMVRPGRLNLMGPWPMKGPFDAIFCRNVMIYFDKATQQELVHRFWEFLKPGGYLFIGHSESLTDQAHKFHYVQPAIYRK